MKYTILVLTILLVTLSSCGWQSEDINTNGENTSPVIEDSDMDEDTTVTPPISAFPDQAFKALGTEPFWSFTYSDQNFEWSEPGEEDIITESHFVQQVYLESENTWYITGDYIAFIITEGTCSDGMSDNVFEFIVEGNYFEREFNGCAEIL
ncbi:hypothetical protein LAT59_01985 [Candidatus Gracilibacteria bacterium]|nr:hypothetical protein [Candidatus Gracilibacteria bacterium]